MGTMNRAEVVGFLGADPELKTLPSGQTVVQFSVATNETWTDKAGKKQERTEWHRIVAWGKLAELCGEYLAKGRQVLVAGSMRTRQWQDKQGAKRNTTEIHARDVVFLGSPQGGGSHAASDDQGLDESTLPPPREE